MKMNNPKKYYKETKNNKPSKLIRDFFEGNYGTELQGKVAIDLGCGAGNDTEFLIEKGFNVIAVDQEEQVREVIENKHFNKEKLKLIIDDFTKTELPNCDLVLANWSLFFVKEDFDKSIEKILKKINTKGCFVGNFLGKEDDWNKTRTTVDKEQLLKYFVDFNILFFNEEKFHKKTALGKEKFWHMYTIIAKKK